MMPAQGGIAHRCQAGADAEPGILKVRAAGTLPVAGAAAGSASPGAITRRLS